MSDQNAATAGTASATGSAAAPAGEVGLSVKCFGQARKANDATSSKGGDPYQTTYQAADRIVPSPFNLLTLASMVEISDILHQCISAMVDNIDGFGWELVKGDWVTGDKLPPAAEEERRRLNMLFNYLNPREDMVRLRKRTRWDLESTGTAYWEIVRNNAGEIAEIYLLPSFTMRICETDTDETDFVEFIRDENGAYLQQPRRMRFRRYVQITRQGQKKVYFKEFGDPRDIDTATGSVAPGTENPANEVIAFSMPCAYSPYGQPRWIGQVLAIAGSRKAEEVNFLFFDNKTIPPVIITVSGGSLGDESVKRLEEIFKYEVQGTANFHRALIIEAKGEAVGALDDKIAPVRVDVKPLTQFIEKDALFSGYRETNRKNLRSSFKLPPIYVGDSADYTRATAMESVRVAEEQVFEPNRRDFDAIINRTIMAAMQINYWTYRSLGAKTTDDAAIVTALASIKEALPVAMLQRAAAQLQNIPEGEVLPEWETTILSQVVSAAPFNDPDQVDPNQQMSGEKLAKYLYDLRERLQKRIDEEINQAA